MEASVTIASGCCSFPLKQSRIFLFLTDDLYARGSACVFLVDVFFFFLRTRKLEKELRNVVITKKKRGETVGLRLRKRQKTEKKTKTVILPNNWNREFLFFFLRTLSDMEFHLSLERGKKNDSMMKRGGENPIRFHILRHWFHVDFVLHLLHTRYRTRGVRNTCVWEGKNRREIFFCC